jgi:hypothetical protein
MHLRSSKKISVLKSKSLYILKTYLLNLMRARMLLEAVWFSRVAAGFVICCCCFDYIAADVADDDGFSDCAELVCKC